MVMTDSGAVEDQTSDEWDKDAICFLGTGSGHQMVSIKVASPAVPFIEQCKRCGFIEPSALTAHAENWHKQRLPRRAQRIAVAVETDPFRFVQSSEQDLTLDEILAQAFAALSSHAAALGASGHASDGKREAHIFRSLKLEIERLMRLDRHEAIINIKQQGDNQ